MGMVSFGAMRPLIFGFWIGIMAALPAVGEDRFKNWVEQEVKWIASKAEAKEFESLTTEEQRRAFIDRFWKRRDPTPETERNEYKESFYERFEYANENFSEGIPGWRTDRGRVYIIHGPPDQEQFVTADSVYTRRGVPSSRGGQGGSASTGAQRQRIVWTYFSVPNAKYYKGRVIAVFEPAVGLTEQDFTLGESVTAQQHAADIWRRSGVQMSDLIPTNSRYRLTRVGRPGAVSSRGTDAPVGGIGDSARMVEDLLRSPGDLLEEGKAEQNRQDSSRQRLREQVSTHVSLTTLPVHMQARCFPEPEMANMALSWQVPISSLKVEKNKDLRRLKLDLMVQVRDVRDGSLVDEIFKPLDVYYTKDQFKELQDESLRYVNEFNLPYGDYEVVSVVKDVYSGRMGSSSSRVQTPPQPPSQVALSDIVLARTLSQEFDPGLGRNLVVNEWQVLPEADSSFRRQEKLVLYFKIYKPSVKEGIPSLVASYKFIAEDGSVSASSGPRKLEQLSDADNGTITFSSIVDLSKFKPGPYQVQVNVVDFLSRDYAINRASFEIR
ncbi:MAG TPA: GWxTD domain-containing protein [Acidobacteriota bacterium]|nr:GWxTD domain-containing protein [Acidobacteriota bacterium]